MPGLRATRPDTGELPLGAKGRVPGLDDLVDEQQALVEGDEGALQGVDEVMQRYWGRDFNIVATHPLDLMLRGAHRLPHDAGLAFFIQPENRELRRFLSQAFTLPPPQYSTTVWS